MYAGRTPTYYDDEAQSLAIATDYDILVDDETLNPSPLHVEDESAHAREVQEGCKRIRAECRRNMMAMMAMALAFLAMALFSIHTSLHRPYGIFSIPNWPSCFGAWFLGHLILWRGFFVSNRICMTREMKTKHHRQLEIEMHQASSQKHEKDVITYLQSTVVARSVYGRVWPLRFVGPLYGPFITSYQYQFTNAYCSSCSGAL
mmetsp:Transcript_15044/g.24479  ORF Transcript_15044/g.24479 Transcript_15044/m.24479 type:complete len:203 (-) Transcript_15044:31-639(-)